MDEELKYEKTQAEKLLQNIRLLADIRKIQVPKPESRGLEQCSLMDWVKWLYKRIEYYGDFGIEGQFLSIIVNIDNNAQLMTNRVEDGFRKLLTIVEKQDIRLAQKELEISELKNSKVEEKPVEVKEEVKEGEKEEIKTDEETEEVKKRKGGLLVPKEYKNKGEKE